jgi:O-antigen/teichoic acid export membrane protein
MDANTITQYVNSYYKTNQTHVAWSFWASLVALVVGLIVLVVGVGLALSGFSVALAITTTAAGVFTQFISAGFFFLYNKNLKQLNVFYRELVQNQDMFFALGLIGHIPEAQRPGIIQALIGRILSRGSSPTQLTPDLVRALNEPKGPQRAP